MKIKKYQKDNYILWLVISYDPFYLEPNIDEPLKLIDDFNPEYQERSDLKRYYRTYYAITDLKERKYFRFQDRKEAKEFLNRLVDAENPPRDYTEIRRLVKYAKDLMNDQLLFGQQLKNDCFACIEDWAGVMDIDESFKVLKVINWILREYE